MLNRYIEQEIYLENFSSLEDIDPTVQNFNYIFVMFMALTLFGFLFEASYLFYYFSLAMEIYIDREEFMWVTRRPSPMETNSIGYFKYFLDICPKLALITISYYISFYLFRVTLNINLIYMIFIIVFAIGILMKQMVTMIPPKGSERMTHLLERQKYLSKPNDPFP